MPRKKKVVEIVGTGSPIIEIVDTKPSFATFKNVTKRNVFTSKGRVGAGQTVEVTFSEGEETGGLEKV